MSSFLKTGKTITFTGATSAPSAVQLLSNDQVRSEDAVVSNVGAVTVFLGWGTDAGVAAANAVIPTSTPSDGYPILAGTKETLKIPSGSWITAITGSSTAIVYVTPGYED